MDDGREVGEEATTCLFPARRPSRAAVLDQDVTRADLFWAKKFRSRKSFDLLLRQILWCIPHGLLRLRVMEIWHLSRIREADFPARLWIPINIAPVSYFQKRWTYHARWVVGVTDDDL